MDYTHVIVHFDEIGLKGKNRFIFENKLVNNIRDSIKDNILRAKKDVGQVILNLAENYDKETITNNLSRLPGIANFSFALESKEDLEEFKKISLELIKDAEKDSTFKIDTKRHKKTFPLKSFEVSSLVGEFVLSKKDLKVKMKNPDHLITIEICQKKTYIHSEKIESMGGLPVTSAKPLMSLLSGGIDSPVASYLMMKRGSKVTFVHFQNEGQMKHSVQGKIEQLVKKLSEIQGKSRLYIIPFADIQKEIIMKVKGKYRMLVYRRFMIRIAEKIAKKQRIKALIMGDNLSQVASQTVPNLVSVYETATMPIFSPLMGYNKREITDLSKIIGTYEISILPYGDCCSFFVDKHPETNSTIIDMRKSENDMDIDEMVNTAIEKAVIIDTE